MHDYWISHFACKCPPYSYRSLDIGLVRVHANEAVPQRGPRLEVQQLDENMAHTVEQAQGVDQATSDSTDTAPVESTAGTSKTGPNC